MNENKIGGRIWFFRALALLFLIVMGWCFALLIYAVVDERLTAYKNAKAKKAEIEWVKEQAAKRREERNKPEAWKPPRKSARQEKQDRLHDRVQDLHRSASNPQMREVLHEFKLNLMEKALTEAELSQVEAVVNALEQTPPRR